MPAYQFLAYKVPTNMVGALRAYIDHGLPPGSFLRAVLENDLMGAIGKADDVNLANLPAFVSYLYNEAPRTCYGSREAVDRWIESKKESA